MNVAVGFEEEQELTEFGLWTLLGEDEGQGLHYELLMEKDFGGGTGERGQKQVGPGLGESVRHRFTG